MFLSKQEQRKRSEEKKMTSFESLPVISRELALVPAPAANSTTKRKPLSLGELLDTHQPKPIPPPIWTKNPMSAYCVLPFADPDDQESSCSNRSRNNNNNNSPEQVDWKQQQKSSSPKSKKSTTFEGTRRRSPVHSVQDQIKFGRRARTVYEQQEEQEKLLMTSSSRSLTLKSRSSAASDPLDGEERNIDDDDEKDDDLESSSTGKKRRSKPVAVIHAHAQADKEWGFQVFDSSSYRPKNLLSLSTQDGKTNHAIHAATARPLPVALTREAVLHMKRIQEDFRSAVQQKNKISHSARTVGGNPVCRVDKIGFFEDENEEDEKEEEESKRKTLSLLVVRGDPVEGKNPDVIPMTRKHKRSLPDAAADEGKLLKGANTRRVLNHLKLLSSSQEGEESSPQQKQQQQRQEEEARKSSPRIENVSARSNKIFLVQPNMKKEPPLLSSRVSAPPKKVVENLLCVSKETCGSKQNFLYKLGDVGRN